MRTALILSLLATPAFAQTIPTFADETVKSGLTHSFTGEWEQIVGGGVATFDCNGDTKPELLLSGGTAPASLWLNTSTADALTFTKVESGAELAHVSGAYPLDVDSDGITDLALLRVGEDVLLRGLGDCNFARANEDWGFSGGDAWSTAFSAMWEKGAALPTLAIGTYIDRTQEAFPWGNCTDNSLYRPTDAKYTTPYPLKPSFCALSMLFTDWNRSGTPSLRVSNDREYYKGGQEQMWHVSPGTDPTPYTDKDGWARLRIWGMGIASRDINGDTYPDYFLTSMADNKLQSLANTDPAKGPLIPKFADIAFAKGVTAHRPYTGPELKPSTAWHAQFEDVNNDTLPDLFIAKGNVWDMPDFAMHDPNNLLLQTADGTFIEAGDKAGVASMDQSRGAALADFNDDGAIDLVVVNRNSPVQLWRNTTVAGNWAKIDLAQPAPNQHAIGAWVDLRIGDAVQRREITVGGGHASGILGPAHFGLGTATAADVRVQWPDGSVTDWQPVTANQITVLTKP